jgi:UDP-2,3-diacylglucosamine pyrophosphatase LpxH
MAQGRSNLTRKFIFMSSRKGTPLKNSTSQPLSFFRAGWLPRIHRRLSQVLETAKTINFDDSSRFVLFSDLHRGNGGNADSFLPNAELFLAALQNYVRRGFTYVEVGDGDELWKGWPFEEIRHAHRRVFDLFHDLDRDRRLHLILGNHDVKRRARYQEQKDGILAHEGLVFRHRISGQQLFVVHGHQADILCDPMHFFARRAARFGYLLRDFLRNWRPPAPLEREKGKLEHRIIDWINARSQIVICGHTHRMSFPFDGDPPYYNTGSGVFPGRITGLEIEHGAIVPVQWVDHGRARYVRQQLGPHQPLR